MKVGAEGTDLWLDLENVKKGRLHVVIHRADITSPEMLQIVQRLSEVERPVDETELAAAGVTRPQLLGYEPFVCPPENDWEVVNGEGKGREGKEEDDDEAAYNDAKIRDEHPAFGKTVDVLKKLKSQNCQYDLDGARNIWICKP